MFAMHMNITFKKLSCASSTSVFLWDTEYRSEEGRFRKLQMETTFVPALDASQEISLYRLYTNYNIYVLLSYLEALWSLENGRSTWGHLFFGKSRSFR